MSSLLLSFEKRNKTTTGSCRTTSSSSYRVATGLIVVLRERGGYVSSTWSIRLIKSPIYASIVFCAHSFIAFSSLRP